MLLLRLSGWMAASPTVCSRSFDRQGNFAASFRVLAFPRRVVALSTDRLVIHVCTGRICANPETSHRSRDLISECIVEAPS